MKNVPTPAHLANRDTIRRLREEVKTKCRQIQELVSNTVTCSATPTTK